MMREDERIDDSESTPRIESVTRQERPRQRESEVDGEDGMMMVSACRLLYALTPRQQLLRYCCSRQQGI